MAHTVLVVDDDPDEMEITRRVLEKMERDLRFVTASRGDTALALLRGCGGLPSLILLDLKMPGMSGIDTLRQIRADQRVKHIPVVIVTNSTLESDRKAAFDAGADGFLHKAFDMEQFSEGLKALLKRWVNG